MKLTRRKLILGAAGAAALLPVSYALRVSLGGYQYPKKYDHLTIKESVIIAALAKVVIGNENPFGISPESVDTVGAVNDFIATNSKLEQGEIRTLLWSIEHVFPIIQGHFKKFTALTTDQQERILQRLASSQNEIPKLLSKAIKTIICFGYFNTPQLKKALGLVDWCGL